MNIGEGMCYGECCEMCKLDDSQTCILGANNTLQVKKKKKKTGGKIDASSIKREWYHADKDWRDSHIILHLQDKEPQKENYLGGGGVLHSIITKYIPGCFKDIITDTKSNPRSFPPKFDPPLEKGLTSTHHIGTKARNSEVNFDTALSLTFHT